MIVEPSGMDVFTHLAWEEYLMEEVSGPVLMLWQSACAVVVGKNQNPWQECRLALMEAERVPLARRSSGGGTVYHDEGNLNYCIVTDREAYREEQAFETVLDALSRVGANASLACKSNIRISGGKISGTAFAFRKGRVLHHGTLLLESDLDRLERYLGSDCMTIKTHAVASVPVKVANLGVSVEKMKEALKASFQDHYDGINRDIIEPDATLFSGRLDKLRSDAWIWGATPRFSIEVDGQPVSVHRTNPAILNVVRPHLYNIEKIF
ncbi:MAG: biotin/lipoate A/B protein ligase family protein [Pontiellaceae bacterium]